MKYDIQYMEIWITQNGYSMGQLKKRLKKAFAIQEKGISNTNI